MDVKYTYFISSTYTDLIAERLATARYILKVDEIPIGMEQFGAVDTTQWSYIERLIKTADYFILILAGRYGAIDTSDSEGLSYTHKEFRFALKNNIPVICMLRRKTDDLPISFNEIEPSVKHKLKAFQDEIKQGRLVDFYDSEGELIVNIAAAITKAKHLFKRPGWVRNVDSVDLADLRLLLNQQKSEIHTLTTEVERYKSTSRSTLGQGNGSDLEREGDETIQRRKVEYLFSLYETIMLQYTYGRRNGSYGVELSYAAVYVIISLRLRDGSYERSSSHIEFQNIIAQDMLAKEAPGFQHDFGSVTIKNDFVWKSIDKFCALGLIDISESKYYLTKFGFSFLVAHR